MSRLIWMTIREDGTYMSTGGARISNTEGEIQLVNGKLSYDSGLSSGILTR